MLKEERIYFVQLLFDFFYDGKQLFFLYMHTAHIDSLPHHEVLEKPRTHDVGGMFWQDPPLILGLFVFAVQQGWEVHVYLQGKKEDWRKRKTRKGKIGLDGTVIVATETKGDNQLPIFFQWQGQKHLLKCHHGNWIWVMILKQQQKKNPTQPMIAKMQWGQWSFWPLEKYFKEWRVSKNEDFTTWRWITVDLLWRMILY